MVNIGDKVFLKCAASGIPLPMITWTLDGRSLDEIKNDLSESRNLRQAMVSNDEFKQNANNIIFVVQLC